MVEEARAGFVAGLEDDLNISEALAAVFTLIKSAYPPLTRSEMTKSGRIAHLRLHGRSGQGPGRETVPDRFGVREINAASELSGAGTVIEAEILAKIEARQKARADRDFKRADAIRDELLEAGIVLEDTKDGVRWKKAGPPKA